MESKNSDVFILSAVRSPIGKGRVGGSLASIEPMALASMVMQEAVNRVGISSELIEDIIWGCVTPIGDQGANLARLAGLYSGFPVQSPAVTLNRMCGSGQQAIHFAAQAILAQDMDIVLAGGTEMMSHQPIGSDWPQEWPKDFPYPLVHQGISAEMMAEKFGLCRDTLDDFSYESHLKASNAIENKYLETQILPISLQGGQVVAIDEGVRMQPDRVQMGNLKAVFKPDGVITAGNSSQISDGAGALVLASEKAMRNHHLKPIARILARVVVGSDPVLMLDGPISATQKVLQKAGLTLDDIDSIEINEAFASVVLGWASVLKPDMSRVNPNGGAIAHGHPLGATGAILMTKLVYELHRSGGKYGLQTMCIGHGMATATIIESV